MVLAFLCARTYNNTLDESYIVRHAHRIRKYSVFHKKKWWNVFGDRRFFYVTIWSFYQWSVAWTCYLD